VTLTVQEKQEFLISVTDCGLRDFVAIPKDNCENPGIFQQPGSNEFNSWSSILRVNSAFSG
jgi:hypothetical protein